ncbi:G patch domain-containing protein 4 [Phymastichus coffea]|uniref:G patch domain-containing protein 4 n=1 Tax=Phymastichus coffea TaxID=108790 RepID=UPI00273C6EA6|nr:G patch domain-containing protein 4 [Phymastichus coffea]
MSSFGKAQLLKYGWTEGKGLGKDENGIAEALKPKLKFDTSGIGHKDTDFQWWTSVYDKALKNVVSENDAEKVSVKVLKENAFNISSTQSGLEVSEKKIVLQYGNFMKVSTLKDGSLIRDQNCQAIEEDKPEDVLFTQISDEELFKACGGRTAHKGARHGLKLSGKLARIAEQEKKLLAGDFLKSTEISSDDKLKLKKAKKRKMVMDVDQILLNTIVDKVSDDEDNIIPPIPNQITDERKLSKKSCKKLNRKVNDLSHQLSKSSLLENNDQGSNNDKTKEQFLDKLSKKSIKKLKRKVNKLSNMPQVDVIDDQLNKLYLLNKTDYDEHNNEDECEQSKKVKKKHKKKRRKQKLDEYNACNNVNNIQLDSDIMQPCLKKFKKHCKDLPESSNTNTENNGIETDWERQNSKYSFCIWRNSKIKAKKLKKYEKKKKNKLVS